MSETTERPPLTYTENGRTSNVLCAWCIEYDRAETLAVVIVDRWPACQRHEELAR